MKTCPKCQVTVTDETKFCPNCGTYLPECDTRFITPQPKNSNNNVLMIIGVVAALLIICALVVYIFISKPDGEKTEEPKTEQVAENDDYESQYDWLSERAVTASDLEGKTAGDLRLLRNAIFARHGYIFKSDDLKEYFSKFSWYKPRYADVNKYLSSLEQKNIAFIQKYEGGGSVVPPAPASVGSLKNISFANDYSDIVCYQKLSHTDLAGLSKSELRILRNTIYARHGRKFKSADMRKYFNGFSWYNGVYDEISPSSLSAIEKHNISVIQSLE